MGVFNTFIILLIGFVLGFEVGSYVMRKKLLAIIQKMTKDITAAAETMRKIKQAKEQQEHENAPGN